MTSQVRLAEFARRGGHEFSDQTKWTVGRCNCGYWPRDKHEVSDMFEHLEWQGASALAKSRGWGHSWARMYVEGYRTWDGPGAFVDYLDLLAEKGAK